MIRNSSSSTHAPATDSNKSRLSYRIIRKKRYGLYGIAFAVLFFVLAQIAVSYYVNLNTVYKHRLNYNMFLEDQSMIEVVIEEIAKTIKRDKLTDYAILIGNSVAWGTNESSEHSLGRYLSDQAAASETEPLQAVFNLSAPSIMAGDAYTLLLMLEDHGIKTDNVFIGLSYSAFVEPKPGPRQVFWLGDFLREQDPEAFADVLPHLQQNQYEYVTGWDRFEENMIDTLFRSIPVVKYKEVIPAYLEQKKAGTDLLGDPRPWNQKQFAESWLTDPQYLSFFDPAPFDMSESNWGVYFMNKIIEHQEGKRLLVFVSGGNGELSKKEVTNPGYIENMAKIEDYFTSKKVPHLMMQDLIQPDHFTDHVHLTKEGNEELAGFIWQTWTGKGE
ncbi:hypothetical protein D3P08_16665 [Paenibacillus nanensis]|uniref:Uncharacterized protein n=1 Tax=Paenibacillus nanensis TaxID=393251 RepID=A0A3A1USM9_9BACL|nr:hypothetical protein [Paenibacillus nanensis]RIX51538.1 hypothetical protein D3P08_16665 [Paenibacillus nanensis]